MCNNAFIPVVIRRPNRFRRTDHLRRWPTTRQGHLNEIDPDTARRLAALSLLICTVLARPDPQPGKKFQSIAILQAGAPDGKLFA